jgi:hypothetical protein
MQQAGDLMADRLGKSPSRDVQVVGFACVGWVAGPDLQRMRIRGAVEAQ